MTRKPAARDALLGAVTLQFALMAVACGDDGRGGGDVDAMQIPIGHMVWADDSYSTQVVSSQLVAALREINAAGGITLPDGTYELNLVSEDHGASLEGAVTAMARFAQQGVTVVNGPLLSSLTLGTKEDFSDGAAAAAVEHNILLVSGGATAPAIGDLQDNDLMWRTVPSDAFQAVVGAEHLLVEEGLSRTAIIHRNDAWGHGLADAFSDAYVAGGGEITGRTQYDVLGEDFQEAHDFTEQLQALFLGKPDVIYLLNFAEVFAIGNQIVVDGYLDDYPDGQPLFFGADGTFATDLIGNLPPEILMRLKGTSPFPDTEGADYQKFVQTITDAGLGEPSELAANRYDAMYLIALAIQKAQSFAADDIKAELRAVSRDDGGEAEIHVGQWALARDELLAGNDVNYEGASGPIEFSESGEVTVGSYVVWEVVEAGGGRFEFDLSNTLSFSTD